MVRAPRNPEYWEAVLPTYTIPQTSSIFFAFQRKPVILLPEEGGVERVSIVNLAVGGIKEGVSTHFLQNFYGR